MDIFKTTLTLTEYGDTPVEIFFHLCSTHKEMLDEVAERCGEEQDDDTLACCVEPSIRQHLTKRGGKSYSIESDIYFNAEEFDKMYLGHEIYHSAVGVQALLQQMSKDAEDEDEAIRGEEVAADIAGYACEAAYGKVLRRIQKMQREMKHE